MFSDRVYYVYTHIDPETDELVYVGKGRGGRAWDVTRNRAGHTEHQDWMTSLMERNWLPSDWVNIVWRSLSEEEAFEKEKELLHNRGTTRFNRQSGERNYQAKLTDEQAREIYKRAPHEFHKDLAKEFGVSRTAVSLIATRKQWRAATACLIS